MYCLYASALLYPSVNSISLNYPSISLHILLMSPFCLHGHVLLYVLCYSEVFIKKHWVNFLFYLMLQQFIALVLLGMGNSNWVVVCTRVRLTV